jgi:hypothetical protein
MAKLCVVLSKPTIKDNRLEKTVSCHLYPIRVKDFTEFALIMTNGTFVIQPVL